MKVAIVALLAALGACGFDIGLRATPDAGRDSGGGSDSGGDDAMDPDMPPPMVDCGSVAGSDLVACFELEDGVADGTLVDSSASHIDAATMGLAPTQRTKPASSAAATMGAAARTYVPDAPRLDLASGYTVTMWIRPTDVPSSGKVLGLFDHEQQYAGDIGRTSTGGQAELRCINTNRAYVYTNPIPVDEWIFIACTWDGSTLCASYWSSTIAHDRGCGTTGISSDGEQGLAIGHLSSSGAPESPLIGDFDSVHVYDRALTSTELCAMVGEPTGCFQ